MVDINEAGPQDSDSPEWRYVIISTNGDVAVPQCQALRLSYVVYKYMCYIQFSVEEFPHKTRYDTKNYGDDYCRQIFALERKICRFGSWTAEPKTI